MSAHTPWELFEVNVRGETGNAGRWLEVFPVEPELGWGSREAMNTDIRALKTMIEAAPALLAACEALDAVLDAVTTPGKGGHWLDKVAAARASARAAIAKAVGE